MGIPPWTWSCAITIRHCTIAMYVCVCCSYFSSLRTQGLASCLEEVFGTEECGRRGIVVGYDARHNSHRLALITLLHLVWLLPSNLRFADLSAAIFFHKNFKVYLFSEWTSTPYTVWPHLPVTTPLCSVFQKYTLPNSSWSLTLAVSSVAVCSEKVWVCGWRTSDSFSQS